MFQVHAVVIAIIDCLKACKSSVHGFHHILNIGLL